jgi:hypothetical protein
MRIKQDKADWNWFHDRLVDVITRSRLMGAMNCQQRLNDLELADSTGFEVCLAPFIVAGYRNSWAKKADGTPDYANLRLDWN